jgi:hypothetical protein
VTDLENSVKELKNVNPIKNGTSAVTSAFDKIKTNADAVVNSAKSDFPSQTKALNDSINALATSVKSLSSAPATAIPALPSQVAAAKSAVDGFSSATSSKCS